MKDFEIMRSCGHKEVLTLQDELEYNDEARALHSEVECDECYLENNDVRAEIMDYGTYKSDYPNYRTKPNSYDKETKTITVYIPAERKDFASIS